MDSLAGQRREQFKKRAGILQLNGFVLTQRRTGAKALRSFDPYHGSLTVFASLRLCVKWFRGNVAGAVLAAKMPGIPALELGRLRSAFAVIITRRLIAHPYDLPL